MSKYLNLDLTSLLELLSTETEKYLKLIKTRLPNDKDISGIRIEIKQIQEAINIKKK